MGNFGVDERKGRHEYCLYKKPNSKSASTGRDSWATFWQYALNLELIPNFGNFGVDERKRTTSSRILDDPTALLQARLCLRLDQALELKGKCLRRLNTVGRRRTVSDMMQIVRAVADTGVDELLEPLPAARNEYKENILEYCYMGEPAYLAPVRRDMPNGGVVRVPLADTPRPLNSLPRILLPPSHPGFDGRAICPSLNLHSHHRALPPAGYLSSSAVRHELRYKPKLGLVKRSCRHSLDQMVSASG
ncbi:hypothetical protein B0H13DRAFT_1851478 [Mycena leptocephala]|nr:hypothetical protein B0H13DRAFT_1851478 [Mycena leptocephala]